MFHIISPFACQLQAIINCNDNFNSNRNKLWTVKATNTSYSVFVFKHSFGITHLAIPYGRFYGIQTVDFIFKMDFHKILWKLLIVTLINPRKFDECVAFVLVRFFLMLQRFQTFREKFFSYATIHELFINITHTLTHENGSILFECYLGLCRLGLF